MCNRYSLTKKDKDIIDRFSIAEQRALFEGKYNIAPRSKVPVVLQEESGRVLDSFKWGLVPYFVKDIKAYEDRYTTLNAKCETIDQLRSFKEAFRCRRCLMPADGFYEFVKNPDKTKTPFRVRLPGEPIYAFAALWDEVTTPEGEPLRTCVMVTAPPNDLTRRIHDRMPVILEPEDEALWLDPEAPAGDLLDALRPYEHPLEIFEVSNVVNNTRNNVPECVVPIRTLEEAGR